MACSMKRIVACWGLYWRPHEWTPPICVEFFKTGVSLAQLVTCKGNMSAPKPKALSILEVPTPYALNFGSWNLT